MRCLAGFWIGGIENERRMLWGFRGFGPKDGQIGLRGDRKNLGVVLWRQGRTEEALEAIRDAIRLAPGAPTYRQNLDRIARDAEVRRD